MKLSFYLLVFIGINVTTEQIMALQEEEKTNISPAIVPEQFSNPEGEREGE